jgi:drug/metabolite transporter (DMT)-like permease
MEPATNHSTRSRPDPMTAGPSHHLLAVSACALAGCLWGTGFLFGKIAMREMTVSENVGFRLLTGALLLAPILFRGDWYRGKELGILLFAALIGVPVQFLVQFKGLQFTTVSHASLIVGTIPVLLGISSAFVLKERLHALEWGAIALSALGAILIARSTGGGYGPRPALRGDLLVFLSLFAAVGNILCTKHLIGRHDALHVTSTTIVIGTLMLLVWVELTEPLRFHFSAGAWGAAAAQGLLATAGAYLFWTWGLAHMPASRAGVFLNLEPVVGTFLGMALLHERLGGMAVLGGLFIVSAAVYFSVRPHPAAAGEIKKANFAAEGE